MEIKMVNLAREYENLKPEIDDAISRVLSSGQFIQGQEVERFESELASYLGTRNVISCANGTDALRIALMALDLPSDTEIIIPAFTYIAAIEVVTLMGLTPVLVDVEAFTFNIDTDNLEEAITDKTRAIIPTHLFGQCSNMTEIMRLANQYDLYVIEDNAQSLGSMHIPTHRKAGTVGHIGCFSFFPTKVLGAYGDGGALCTDDPHLAQRISMIANHGQIKKYDHHAVGLNSRLDAIQAAILDIKLQHLETSINKRQQIAEWYADALAPIAEVEAPATSVYSDHIYHQYTIKVSPESRNDLKIYLAKQGISTMIYYPVPTHHQPAYKRQTPLVLPISTALCHQVLSLPMHPLLTQVEAAYICEHTTTFYS